MNKFERTRDLLLELTKRELKIRYKSTYLGFLWTLINPVIQMTIIGSVFSLFINIPNYFIFLLSGLLPWQFFSSSLSMSVSSFLNERGMLHKAKFAYYVIPLSTIFANFILFIASLTLFITYHYLTSQSLTFTGFLLLLLSLSWILIFTSAFTLLTSTLLVSYRDVKQAVSALLTLWFYATPIIYSLDIVPQYITYIIHLNPLTYPFSLIKTSLLDQALPSQSVLISNLSITTFIILISIYIYKKASPYFVDHV